MLESNENKNELNFRCDCGGGHFLCFTFWNLTPLMPEEELFIEVIDSDNGTPFWERVKRAFTFIFKGGKMYWHEIILDKSAAQKIVDFIEEFKKSKVEGV